MNADKNLFECVVGVTVGGWWFEGVSIGRIHGSK